MNDLDLGREDHSPLKLSQSLHIKGVNAICLSKINVYWKRIYLENIFKRILTIYGPDKNYLSVPQNQIKIGTIIINLERRRSLH